MKENTRLRSTGALLFAVPLSVIQYNYSTRRMSVRSVFQILCYGGFFFCSTLLAAQASFTIGPKVGLNLKDLGGKGAVGYSIRPDFNVGLAWNWIGSSAVSVGGELVYSGQGARLRNSNVLVSRTQLSYLILPVLFKYYFWSSTRTTPLLFAGPQVGYLLTARNTVAGSQAEAFKKLDISAVAGAGLRMQLEKVWWTVDVRFAPGVVNISQYEPVVRNSVFSLNTSVEFGASRKSHRGLH